MAPGRWPLERLVQEVALLGRKGLSRDEYFSEVAGRLRRVVNSDATCWHTLDPQTGLITSDAPDELISAGIYTRETAAAAGATLIASEYLIEDFNTFAGLAARRTPVGVLSQVTRGRPERSTRYRDLLAPSGIPFELRAAFVARGRCWGAVHIARGRDGNDFTDDDARALAAVTGAIANGIRTSLRFDAARRSDDPSAPGMVVLNASNQIELMTAPAVELLAALRTPAASADAVPSPVLALATFARSRASDPDAQCDAIAVPASGGWITLHASLPAGSLGQVAIVVERTTSPQTTALRLEVEGVTPREREIATLLAQGLTNAEVAEALVVSPYTVQDHIKSLFEKTQVSSRQELVARVFLDHYLPQIASRSPLTSRGGFAEQQRA
jgi:DNA-binding NarL/FixJ family response regulator